MSESPLMCNLIACRKKLNSQACVTFCSHIFCAHHMSALKNKDKPTCLACGTHLKHELDVVCVDLNPTEQYKTMILTGLSPDQIMDIATRAIGFYVYQLNYNCQDKDASLRSTKEQFDEMKHYCSNLTSKFKTDLLKEQRRAANLKQELEEKIKEVEAQQQQVAQWKTANKKLQMKLESQKREIINLTTPPTNSFPNAQNDPFGNIFSNYTSSPFQLDRSPNYGGEASPPFKPFGRFSH